MGETSSISSNSLAAMHNRPKCEGFLSGKKIQVLQQSLSIVLIILGFTGLGVAGIGFACLGVHQGWWIVGGLSSISQISSIVMITIGGGGGIPLLMIGIIGLVTATQKKGEVINSNTVIEDTDSAIEASDSSTTDKEEDIESEREKQDIKKENLTVNERRILKLAELTTRRNKRLAEARAFNEDTQAKERGKGFKKVQKIEFEAATIIRKARSARVRKHIELSLDQSEKITRHDGIINEVVEDAVTIKDNINNVVGIDVTEVGGLSQVEAQNNLCGYYALFFMLQAVTNGEFANRQAFNLFLERWIDMIAIKRTASQLSNKRNEAFSDVAYVTVEGLVHGDMQYLIDQCEELKPLRDTNNCFVFDIDEYVDPYKTKEARDIDSVKFLGKSRTDNEILPHHPLYFILQADGHYYFAYNKSKQDVTNPVAFTFVHSLNYSVLNPNKFSMERFLHIKERLVTP